MPIFLGLNELLQPGVHFFHFGNCLVLPFAQATQIPSISATPTLMAALVWFPFMNVEVLKEVLYFDFLYFASALL